ncbi:DinB family protein [Neobacillus sp. PS3-34]|uniref:DinB family protein n=1 Tax=Neobacillus sp. PS3-34 TaxID=3070678 RepID=UPI0027E05D81|nr:DinB family protein [Neobacillus sp. PS3-34]WML47156.1 DinB family protein [Neobacillus sp. PS3-34]
MILAKQLFEYHEWATKKLLFYIEENCPQAFNQQIESVFKSIKETAEHLYIVDVLWFDRIQGKETSNTDITFNSADEAKGKINELHRNMTLYLKGEDISRIVTYKNSSGDTFENTLEDICTHLANHGTYHRGNITAMLWSMGHKSIATDYVYFLREIKNHKA